jgi:hypothetical protein
MLLHWEWVDEAFGVLYVCVIKYTPRVGEKKNHVKFWLISPAPDQDSKLVPSKRSQARQNLILVGWINSNWNGTSLECWLAREKRITRKEIYPSSISPQVPAEACLRCKQPHGTPCREFVLTNKMYSSAVHNNARKTFRLSVRLHLVSWPRNNFSLI